ncbi:MAG TPA: capsid cement protein [Paracoccaceae bacterium]|nr:capsid cement protein [Paracoccaceae bacterium]
MAKNYIQPGDNMTVSAPYAVSSGDGALVGSLFGVAVSDADNGAPVVLSTTGVWRLAKTKAQAWAVGALVYWDNSTKVATTTGTDNKLIGVAAADAANPSDAGLVRLNGAFTA